MSINLQGTMEQKGRRGRKKESHTGAGQKAESVESGKEDEAADQSKFWQGRSMGLSEISERDTETGGRSGKRSEKIYSQYAPGLSEEKRGLSVCLQDGDRKAGRHSYPYSGEQDQRGAGDRYADTEILAAGKGQL